MSDTKQRRLKITPGTNIRWEHTYGVFGDYHWCLVSDESDADGKCISPYTVLLSASQWDLSGNPLDENPDLSLYADAHNTANEVDMLPSELLAKLREAVDLLEQAIEYSKEAGRYTDSEGAFAHASETKGFLLTLNLPKP